MGDLEAVPLDGDHEAEARAMLKGGMLLPLLCPPSGLLQGVGHHISRVTVIAWIEVKGNVCPCPRTTLQIHMEPERERETEREREREREGESMWFRRC